MLRTLVVVIACLNVKVFGYDIKLSEKELDFQQQIVIGKSIQSNGREEANYHEDIYNLTPEALLPQYEELNYLGTRYRHPSQEEIEEAEEDPTLQPWSILWYIGSFGGLIAFFLVVSCSEWCCRNRVRRRNSGNSTCPTPTPSEAPPPAYDLFAPPSYDSLCSSNGEKIDYQVYVVPVHALETISEDAILQTNSYPNPPPLATYYTSQDERSENACSNEVVLNVVRRSEEETRRERHKEQREIATQT